MAAYAGKRAAPASAYSGNLSSCMTVGTRAVPRATIASISPWSRPVPCSMQSMPASISQGSTSLPKQCAVTRAPFS